MVSVLAAAIQHLHCAAGAGASGIFKARHEDRRRNFAKLLVPCRAGTARQFVAIPLKWR